METSTPKRRKIFSIPFTPRSSRDSSAAKLRTVTVSTPKEEIAVSPAKTNGIQYFSVSYRTTGSSSRDRASPGFRRSETNGTPSRKSKLHAKEKVMPGSRFAISTGKTTLIESSPTSREPRSKAMEIRKPSTCGNPQQAVNEMGDHSSDDLAIAPADANPTTTPSKTTHQAKKVSQHEPNLKAPPNWRSPVGSSEQPPHTPQRSHLEDTDDGEPTLPLTPAQLGLEAPSPPPSGLSNFSVSRRSKIKYRSSPLKPKDEETGDLASSPIRASRSPSVQARSEPKRKRSPVGSASSKRPLR
ncbi:MAG: hypothetical protein LQ350_002842 [Teloschistes chrysophthalmus]|nr:MAG: hypothetical protein LQ350_002842 [Niorma chrysophthalma]